MIKKIGISLIVVFVLMSFQTETTSEKLATIITNYQDRESYDEDEFPLGLFAEEYYLAEANYAKDLLNKLSKISGDDLSETENISFKLLQFQL